MWCTSCGTQAPTGVRFCPACGAMQPVPETASSRHGSAVGPLEAAPTQPAPWQHEPEQPGPARRGRRGLGIALVLVAAAGAAAVGFVVATGMFSGPDLTRGSIVSPVAAGTPVSSAEELLAIAESTGAENCEVADRPYLDATHTVNCSPAGEALFSASFSAYDDPGALDRNTPSSAVLGVPGEDDDCAPGQTFTGTWEQDGRGGMMSCSMGSGNHLLVWTENSRLLMGGLMVVEPEQEASRAQIEAAYGWWQDNATLD